VRSDRLRVNTTRFLLSNGLGWATKCMDVSSCNEPVECTLKSLKKCLKGLVIIGIDPGVTTGVAITVNDILVYGWEGPREKVVEVINKFKNIADIIVVGKGGHDLVAGSKVPIIEVEEAGTSNDKLKLRKGIGKHVRSAYLIALRKPITSQRGYRRGLRP